MLDKQSTRPVVAFLQFMKLIRYGHIRTGYQKTTTEGEKSERKKERKKNINKKKNEKKSKSEKQNKTMFSLIQANIKEIVLSARSVTGLFSYAHL